MHHDITETAMRRYLMRDGSPRARTMRTDKRPGDIEMTARGFERVPGQPQTVVQMKGRRRG